MASFQDQVQALTSLTMGSGDAPTTAQLTQYLHDGVLDVTAKWLLGHPMDVEDFTRESDVQTANGSLDLNGAHIISAVREDGTEFHWSPCGKISPSLQYKVLDSTSLSYASKFNPVYMIGDDGKISVFPVPGVSGDNFKVYYINNVPRESAPGSTVIDQDSTSLAYFLKPANLAPETCAIS